MKILAIPLARQRASGQLLFTYLGKPTAAPKGGTEKPEKLPPGKRIMNASTSAWIRLGRTDVRSTFDWRRRVFVLGERVMDQIGYEEWALKDIDSAIGKQLEKLAQTKAAGGHTPEKIALCYSKSVSSGSLALSSLESLVRRRGPQHYYNLLYCLVGIPITMPLFLVPIIPNIPTYYLMWRASYVAAKSTLAVITRGLVEPQADASMNRFLISDEQRTGDSAQKTTEYAQNAADDAQDSGAAGVMLMTKEQAGPLIGHYALNPQAQADLTRALDQAQLLLQRERESGRHD
ncbi:hypothetical protein MSPP1_001971 [Malassezia sp. CBS 17886]|nr:hypothetical protein MSPP1_001971 [Malassezia sp. CBS 17886]